MKRLVASILLIAWVLSSSLCVFADYATTDNHFIKQEKDAITREEAVAIFVRSIGLDTTRTNPNILWQFQDYGKISSVYTREIATAISAGMVSGYEDKTFRPLENITRVEALVILNRILGTRSLPAHISLSFFDTPLWAEADISRLTASGIVQGYGNGYLGAKDNLSRSQTVLLANRAKHLLGPTGDFYEYVNGKWLSETELPSGYSVWSDFHQINQTIMKENGEIIYSINKKRNKEGVVYPAGSCEQKIADLFAASGNTLYRESLGLKPAEKYLSLIDSIKDTKSFLSVMASLEQCGFHGLLPLSIEINILDSSEYILTFSGCYSGIGTDAIHSPNKQKLVDAYQTYLEELFELFGFDNSSARAKKTSEFCVNLANASSPMATQNDLEKNYTILEGESLKNTFSKLNFNQYTKELGFTDVKKIACYDLSLAEKINTLIQNTDLSLLKDYLRASVLDGSSLYLNTDAFDIWQNYQNTLTGTEDQSSLANFAVQFIEELLRWDLAELYVKHYASSDSKTAIEDMTREILLAYKNRVRINTWMSKESKEMALKKLDNLQIRVGYPDDIEDYPDAEYEIKSTTDGGNILDHRVEYCKRYFKTGASRLASEKPNKTIWNMVPQTVNAMYEPTTNSITIPLGILRPPFYDPNVSREQNLGGIGSVIAHEISHALDDVGSRFDEKGNLNPWWKPEDKVAFSKICKDVESAYSSISPMPEMNIDGKQTLSENLADLAGMSCLLDVVGTGNPRLEDLFFGYASIWRNKSTDSYKVLMLETDKHSPDKTRVNRVLSNFEIFQDFYDVQPGDGMYLSKEEQIQIWNR